MFLKARDYINIKREKEESISRLSRDITWECKRLIFNLHRFHRSDRVISDSKSRLKFLTQSDRHFLGLARALEGEEPSLHNKRTTHCLQEFIEAWAFLVWLEERRIPNYDEVKKLFEYNEESTGEEDKKNNFLSVPCSLQDFVLGLADFTGELMKATVPALTRPELHTFLFQSLVIVREIYRREFFSKIVFKFFKILKPVFGL
jgi:predicted translin family RNA/ssDNA-binding protein